MYQVDEGEKRQLRNMSRAQAHGQPTVILAFDIPFGQKLLECIYNDNQEQPQKLEKNQKKENQKNTAHTQTHTVAIWTQI